MLVEKALSQFEGEDTQHAHSKEDRNVLIEEVRFGQFRLLPTQRILLEGDVPVRIGGRALDILIALIAQHGRVVSKKELVAMVWPDTFVDEGNLKVHIAALRRAIGEDQFGNPCISTVIGRGYCFVMPIVKRGAPSPVAIRQRCAATASSLPKPLARLIGIEPVVSRISELLKRHRLITLTGPGGIGKTSSALAAAGDLVDRFGDGICFVDLAAVGDPDSLREKVASATRLRSHPKISTTELLKWIGGRRMLLLFDNCEHLVDEVAELAVQLIQAAPEIQILATSREPLGVDGEHVYHMQALAVPEELQNLGVVEALEFPAIALFVERTADVLGEFSLVDADIPAICEICRKLDGMPLAIELAAASMPAFGLQGVVLGSRRPLQLPRIGRRNAPARHKTLRTVLDWSYALLNDAERRVLQQLSTLPNEFSMDLAAAAAAGVAETKTDAAECVISLIMKSLVSVSRCGADTALRLQSATRAYAAERLHENCDRDRFRAIPVSDGVRECGPAGRRVLHRGGMTAGDLSDRTVAPTSHEPA